VAAYTEDQGINMIRIDEFIRNDCDTSIGESVIVTKVEPVEAISVKLAPTETRIKVDNEFLRFVKDRLINRPAIKGDTLLIITLLTTTAHAQQTQIQPRVGHRLT